MRAFATAVVAGSLVALTASADPPTKTVTIEVTAKATAHLGETFDATIRTINTTGTRQSWKVMSCSWPDQWRTDDPTVTAPGGVPCDKNVEHTVDLAPGAVDTRTLQLTVQPKAAIGSHAVRLGFTPEGEKTTLWSSTLSIQILAAPRK